MNSLKRAWKKMFSSKYLLVTNTISSGVLLGAGDGIQQGIEFTRGKNYTVNYDWQRTGRLFTVGLIEGPPHHIFYTVMDKVMPGKSARIIVKKILADQIIAAPFFAITFFMGAGILEGKTSKEAWEEFERKFPAVYAFDWCIWPPSQALNFYYIPGQYRVLYVNAVTVIWDVFLSFMKHKDQETLAQQHQHCSPANGCEDLDR